MKTCSHAKYQVKSCYGYWVTLLHEEEAEAEEDEEFVKSCFTCIPYLVWHFHPIFCMQLLFYMFFTLMSLKDRLRLKLKVKTKISLCMAIMLDNPWQSLYTQYYRTVWYVIVTVFIIFWCESRWVLWKFGVEVVWPALWIMRWLPAGAQRLVQLRLLSTPVQKTWMSSSNLTGKMWVNVVSASYYAW